MQELWLFLLIWGVWILMPIVVDGMDTLVRLFVVLIWGRDHRKHDTPDEELPYVTILVPAYNEEQVIDRCLNSIKIQDYPHEKLEVVVINDGSTDYTAERVMNHIAGEFQEGNGNGFSNGYHNGNGSGNGNGHNGNGFSHDGGDHNSNGNGNGNGYHNGNGERLPKGIYSTRDFKNGNGNGHNGNGHNGNGNGFGLNGNGYHNGNGHNGNGHNGNGNGFNGFGLNGNGYHNGNGHNGNGNGNGNGYLKINGDTYLVPPFNGEISLISNGHIGKPKALNLGIKHMNGSDIIITLDSDVVLAPYALRNMACAFVENPDMSAATGHIEVSEDIVEERDEFGNLVLDEDGKLITKKLSFWQLMLAKCQFLEYLDAFRLGRQFQSVIGSTYILAGAFSAFRRSIMLNTELYKSRTVSEDFDITADLHRTGARIGYVADAKALLEPVVSWDELFSQRVRWCRGQLEVCGAHEDMIGNRKFGSIGWFGFPQMLITDHTLAFPRLIWTLLILLFPLFGYPVGTIALAILFMYLFYIGLGFAQTAAAYSIVDDDTKKRTESALAWNFILPVYRLAVFYFRMSGYLRTLKEPSEWEVTGPLVAAANGVNGVKNGLNGAANGLKNGFKNGFDLLVIARQIKARFAIFGRRAYHHYATNGGSKTFLGRLARWVSAASARLRGGRRHG